MKRNKFLMKFSLLIASVGLLFGGLLAIGNAAAFAPQTVYAAKGSKPKGVNNTGGGSHKQTNKNKTNNNASTKTSEDDSNAETSSGDDSSDDEYSFYHLASSAASYFDASQNPATGVKFRDNGVTIGNSAGMIGYEDQKYDKNNWIGTITAGVSKANDGKNYEQFQEVQLENMYFYAMYGHALESMGLDRTDQSASVQSLLRRGMGFVLMIGYAAAVSVPLIFSGVARLLVILNPFQFFKPAISRWGSTSMQAGLNQAVQTAGLRSSYHTHGGNYGAWSNTTQGTSLGGNHSVIGGAFQTGVLRIQKMIGSLYNVAQEWGLMIVVPITLFICILMYFLFNLQIGSTLKKFIIRLLVIVVGVPMLGIFYSRTLQLFTNGSATSPSANIILASTMDDFQGWAQNTRLAFPNGIGANSGHPQIEVDMGDSKGGTVNLQNSTDVRDLSLKINYLADNGLVSFQEANDIDATPGNAKTSSQEAFWKDQKDNLTTTGHDTGTRLGAGFSLLGRFLSDQRYTAADYETFYKSNPSAVEANDAMNTTIQTKNKTKKEIMEGIKYLTNENHFTQDFSKNNDGYFINVSHPKAKGMLTTFLTDSDTGSIWVQHPKLKNQNAFNTRAFTIINGYNGSHGKDGVGYGLSPLGMYNYLTTDFSNANIENYSEDKASSGLVAKTHMAVNIVGTSNTSFAYWLNATILFAAVALIGWGYAIATLMSTISKSFSFIIHMPFAMGGSLQAAARMITAVMFCIVQLMMTMFLFAVAMDMLMALNLGTSSIFGSGGDSSGSSAFLTTGVKAAQLMHVKAFSFNSNSAMTLVWLLISSGITAWFAIMALRVRGTTTKAIADYIGQLIDRLFMNGKTNPLSTGQANAAGAAEANQGDGDDISKAAAAYGASYLLLHNKGGNSLAKSHVNANSKANNKNNLAKGKPGKGHGESGHIKGASKQKAPGAAVEERPYNGLGKTNGGKSGANASANPSAKDGSKANASVNGANKGADERYSNENNVNNDNGDSSENSNNQQSVNPPTADNQQGQQDQQDESSGAAANPNDVEQATQAAGQERQLDSDESGNPTNDTESSMNDAAGRTSQQYQDDQAKNNDQKLASQDVQPEALGAQNTQNGMHPITAPNGKKLVDSHGKPIMAKAPQQSQNSQNGRKNVNSQRAHNLAHAGANPQQSKLRQANGQKQASVNGQHNRTLAHSEQGKTGQAVNKTAAKQQMSQNRSLHGQNKNLQSNAAQSSQQSAKRQQKLNAQQSFARRANQQNAHALHTNQASVQGHQQAQSAMASLPDSVNGVSATHTMNAGQVSNLAKQRRASTRQAGKNLRQSVTGRVKAARSYAKGAVYATAGRVNNSFVGKLGRGVMAAGKLAQTGSTQQAKQTLARGYVAGSSLQNKAQQQFTTAGKQNAQASRQFNTGWQSAKQNFGQAKTGLGVRAENKQAMLNRGRQEAKMVNNGQLNAKDATQAYNVYTSKNANAYKQQVNDDNALWNSMQNLAKETK